MHTKGAPVRRYAKTRADVRHCSLNRHLADHELNTCWNNRSGMGQLAPGSVDAEKSAVHLHDDPVPPQPLIGFVTGRPVKRDKTAICIRIET